MTLLRESGSPSSRRFLLSQCTGRPSEAEQSVEVHWLTTSFRFPRGSRSAASQESAQILVQNLGKKTLISAQNLENKGPVFSCLLDLWFLR
jgi:hypothetical protein